MDCRGGGLLIYVLLPASPLCVPTVYVIGCFIIWAYWPLYKAPPDERGGNRYVLPNATAPHLDSTNGVVVGTSGVAAKRSFVGALFHRIRSQQSWPLVPEIINQYCSP